MRLSLFTDYSLRVLMYSAAHQDRLVTTKEIGDYYDISYNHLVKVVHKLSQNGFIQIRKGKGGGIELASSPEEIMIGKVIRAMEPDFDLVGCFSCASKNGCAIVSFCSLKKELKSALDAFLNHLDQISLATMIHNKQKYWTQNPNHKAS